jgi:arginase
LTDELRLICCPFHNGRRGVSMGAGPIRLAADEPFRRGIEAAGWNVSSEEIAAIDGSGAEIRRVMELIRTLAGRVRQAAADGAFPLVLAGNCNSALGTTAGIGTDDLGVVWFDAHADFDDPEENTSGFFDVMGLAMLTGRGWRALRQTIPGHVPVPEPSVVLAAVRDLEPYQRRRLEQSDVLAVPETVDPGRFEQAIDDLASRVSRIYLHVDLDSIDAGEARANEYAAPGGPVVDRLAECVSLVARRFDVAAAAITAYDPTLDEDDRTLVAARRIACEIAEGVRFTFPSRPSSINS